MAKSTVPVLEVYKATAKKENPLLQGNKAQTENVAAGAKIAELGFDAASKVPSEHDANASFLQTIRKDLGDKPKGWRALAAGVTEGMEFGEKRKSILDSKERLAKYQGTLKKLEDVVALSGERLAGFQKGEEVKQSLTPYVSRTLDLILEGAPQERIDLAGVDLTDRYNQQTGENWKYEMGNGKGVAVVDRNTGQSAIIPWSKLTAPELQEKVIMADPVYQSQLARQQKREDQEVALSERNTAANETRANASMMKAKNDQGTTPEEQEAQTYVRLRELLKAGDPTTGIWSSLGQSVGMEASAQQQEYQQLLADLKLIHNNVLKGKNKAALDSIETLGKGTSRETAFDFINNELVKRGYPSETLMGVQETPVTPVTAPPAPQAAPAASSTAPQEATIIMIDPKTKQEEPVPLSQLKRALELKLVPK